MQELHKQMKFAARGGNFRRRMPHTVTELRGPATMKFAVCVSPYGRVYTIGNFHYAVEHGTYHYS